MERVVGRDRATAGRRRWRRLRNTHLTTTTTVTLEETDRAIALCSRPYRSRQVTISTRPGPTTGRMTEEACAQIAARLGVISDMAAL
jgi:hypothetical protein